MIDTDRRGKDEILTAMQSFVAELAVNSSVIRNQGAGGLIATARDFFKKIDLSAIPLDSADFAGWLDSKTADLLAQFPANASYFGTARKALNIFLRDAVYNTALNHAFRLDGPYPLMEAPIDSYAAKHLRALCGNSVPRVWPGLKHLTATEHDQYQQAATGLAQKWGVHPADLDVFFFRV